MPDTSIGPPADGEISLRLTVNGIAFERQVRPTATLAEFLRDTLGLTGTHIGCGEGVCGSCTILLDGSTARACLLLAVQADGAQLTTVEGLECDTDLASLQRIFAGRNAAQCGFCTPGMLMTIAELAAEAREDGWPDEAGLRRRLSGVACRCTGYAAIVRAAQDFQHLMAKQPDA